MALRAIAPIGRIHRQVPKCGWRKTAVARAGKLLRSKGRGTGEARRGRQVISPPRGRTRGVNIYQTGNQ
jgi:hypothetical protein